MASLPIIGINAQDEVFKVVEDMPRFPGCEHIKKQKKRYQCAEDKMLDFIYENVDYPEEDQDAGIEGRVIVNFIVKKDGSIEFNKIARGLSPSLDDAVRDVIELMGEEVTWIPGRHKGEAKNVIYTLPVLFYLD